MSTFSFYYSFIQDAEVKATDFNILATLIAPGRLRWDSKTTETGYYVPVSRDKRTDRSLKNLLKNEQQ